MDLKPLGDRLLVRVMEADAVTAGGVIIPDNAQEQPQRGLVLAVGPGAKSEKTGDHVPMDIAEDDEIIFSKYGGTTVRVESEEIMVLRESDVLAKIV